MISAFDVGEGLNYLYGFFRKGNKIEPAEINRWLDIMNDEDVDRRSFLSACKIYVKRERFFPTPVSIITIIEKLREIEADNNRDNYNDFRATIYDKVFNILSKKKFQILNCEGSDFLSSPESWQVARLLSYTGAFTVETWTTGDGAKMKTHQKYEFPEPAIILNAWKAVQKS